MSSAAAGEVLLEGRDLEKTYEMGDRGLKVLRGVSVEVRKGEILAIQGPSGAGKSTLLHLLGLLDEPDRGQVLYRGEDLLKRTSVGRASFRNERVGFVFQFYHLFPDLTALENVCLPKMVGLSGGAYGAQREAIEARAAKLLGMIGLAERMTHRPAELSGGERQRVAIARALMSEPEIVMCDEPTGNLDQKRAQEILDVIWKLNAETGQTFVIVTHDNELARRAHRKIHVVDGVLAADGAPPQPRGFAETRFRLRDLNPARPAPASVVAYALIPKLLLVWLYLVLARFMRATRRGISPLAAVVTSLIPLVGNVRSLWLHAGPLRAANRLLVANGEEPLPAWPVPVVLWGIGWNLAYGSLLLLATRAAPIEELATPFLAGQALLGIAAAWLQSLHNTFYDRMLGENAERTG